MLLKLPVCILIVAMIFSACQTTTTYHNSQDSLISNDTNANKKTSSPMIDPDPTDSIPADGYNASGADVQVADVIKKSLAQNILKNELSLIPDEERKFKYASIDLNNDGNNEYFVAFNGIYFCGSDGCTALLLNHDGTLITKFTAMDWPVYVDSTTTNNWRDIIVKSNGRLHTLKMNNNSYPNDVSNQPTLKGDVPADATIVLDIYKDAFPSFKF